MDTCEKLGVYGSIYDGQVSNVSVEVVGGGLDVTGVVGDHLEFAAFFDYMTLTGYEFSGYIVLDSSPLTRTHPIIVVPIDLDVGLIGIKLTAQDTTAIGPVSGKPWFLQWTDPSGVKRQVLAGKFALNRDY